MRERERGTKKKEKRERKQKEKKRESERIGGFFLDDPNKVLLENAEQNFLRVLGAVGPHEFQGKFDGPMSFGALFLRGDLYGRMPVSVATPAEPRGEEKKSILCKFWAVKNF